ncbi:YhcB family protein [Allohahella marinimesophila]|uniref:Z-ring associated protein G n=1 Tax=Allohahella marinimesophila TaxID=1054972 RepID=A0ABP7PY76_9GAMM
MTPFWIAVSVAVSFAVGLLIGIVLHKTASPGSTKRRRLEGQMDQMRDEYVRYQADVTHHFSEAAQLIKRLNKDYESVITHLTKGANKLAGEADFDSSDLLRQVRANKADSPDDIDYSNTENLRERLRLPPDVAIEGYEGLGMEAAPSSAAASSSSDRSGARKKSNSPGQQKAASKPEPLQVPGTSTSSIQGVRVAQKHVKTVDYDEQHVDGYVEAPRDYAPRRGPEDNGTLTEGYNLSRDDSERDLRH